jgi:hypothetical protein
VDAAGERVNWTAPPYYVNGRLMLVLEGEDPTKIPLDVQRKRTLEYYRSRRRQQAAYMERLRVTGKRAV